MMNSGDIMGNGLEQELASYVEEYGGEGISTNYN